METQASDQLHSPSAEAAGNPCVPTALEALLSTEYFRVASHPSCGLWGHGKHIGGEPCSPSSTKRNADLLRRRPLGPELKSMANCCGAL